MNWDDVKYFLAVARAGQMLGAATRLGVSQAKLGRRITSLENSLDARLFERSTTGCELTSDGAALMDIATRIEEEFMQAQSAIRSTKSAVSGTVRIGAPDGLGVGFIAPNLHLLAERHPELNVQLVPIPHSFSLSRREADIAVMVGRPEKGRLRIRKLTDYTLGVYASKNYLARFGIPETLTDLGIHRLVGYVEDLIFTPELNYSAEITRNWQSSLEISTALGQLEAVRTSAGIGILHDFMGKSHPELVRLFPATNIKRDYWTVWHESMNNTKRVSAIVRFLDDIVKANRGIFIAAN